MLTDQTIQIDYGKLDAESIQIFNKRLPKKITTLNRYLTHLPTPPQLKIKIEHTQHGQCTVILNLFIGKTINSNAIGKTAVIALENAFDHLKENLLQTLDNLKQQHEYTSRQKRSQILNAAYGTLQKYVVNNDKNTFSKQLLPLIDDLRKYLQRHFNYARLIGKKGIANLNLSEAVNQVVLLAFQRFEQKPKDFSLEHWLFQLADEALEKLLAEYRFENQHLENWDKYVQQAVDDQDVQIAMSAEGYPELIEDLDDIEEINTNLASHLGYEVDYSQNLDDKEEKIKIMRLLAKLPLLQRSVFDLYAVDSFSIAEIARLKKLKETEVEKIIQEVRIYLQKRLKG